MMSAITETKHICEWVVLTKEENFRINKKGDDKIVESMDLNDDKNTNMIKSAKNKSYLKKLTVILDLDGTLMCTHQKNKLNSNIQNYSSENIDVVMRPEVKHFILKLQKFADLVIFTASTQSYADPLIDLLDPTNTIFKHRYYRDSTISTKYECCVKDLNQIGYLNKSRVVLLDDRPYSAILQPFNLVPCTPFEGHDDRDCHLMMSVYPLLKHLSKVLDVRDVLRETFRMDLYFIKWGIPKDFIKSIEKHYYYYHHHQHHS